MTCIFGALRQTARLTERVVKSEPVTRLVSRGLSLVVVGSRTTRHTGILSSESGIRTAAGDAVSRDAARVGPERLELAYKEHNTIVLGGARVRTREGCVAQ